MYLIAKHGIPTGLVDAQLIEAKFLTMFLRLMMISFSMYCCVSHKRFLIATKTYNAQCSKGVWLFGNPDRMYL